MSKSPTGECLYPISSIPATPPAGGGGIGVFDAPEAKAINEARMRHLDSLGLPIAGRSVLDAGSGVGHLAQYFVERNCRVVCVDGRGENIAILRLRYPQLEAHVADVERHSLRAFGEFDIVFCYGLLYHLENPVGGLRNLAEVCKHILLLETVVIDHPEPVLRLLDEPPSTPNQALGPLGCRPAPAFVALALTRAGFRYVYAPRSRPGHPDFHFDWRADLRFSRDNHLLRCVFIASREPLDSPELSLLVENPNSQRQPFVEPAPSHSPERIWLDVGAHLGEKTFAAAQADAALRVFAFEPNLSLAAQRMGALSNFIVLPLAIAEHEGSVTFRLNAFDAASSILPMVPAGLQAWRGGGQLEEIAQYSVPCLRLDTFLNRAAIRSVEFLKIDAQGADLAVVRSAGERLKDIQKISLEVQITPVPLYEGGSRKEDVVRYLEEAGFQLTQVESQSDGQEENLTFERLPGRVWANEAEILDAAKSAAYVRPLIPYPGWSFGAGWDDPGPAFRLRRKIWEHANRLRLQTPLVFEWYDGLKLNLYLGNDLSRQLFIAGCAEPNEMAFLNEILAPGMVFIDGGANDGIYTLFASRRVGPGGKVWAFEPSTREAARLRQNLDLNQLENVTLFQAALADRNGEEDLSVAGYEHEGQNTLGAFVHDGVESAGTERVAVRKLDDLVFEERLNRVDVIKLDVEGAENRVLDGARDVLAKFRPIVIFEALDPALRKQGSSLDQLLEVFASSAYNLLTFDEQTGRPVPAGSGPHRDNMIALPSESPLLSRFGMRTEETQVLPVSGHPREAQKESYHLLRFSPARAYWNQRVGLANARDRILALSRAVNHASDLWPYQWAQLMSVVMDYQPDVVLELGRGKGNSTCAFTEASNLINQRTRILSLCLSDNWERETLPKVRSIVPKDWFTPLQALRADILEFDYELGLSGCERVVIFWDAHGFEIAECVLGEILPVVAGREHLVIMHDLSDARYSSEEQLEYGPYGLWKGNDWSGPRLKLGFIDSAVEQSIAALDFTTRNHLTLDSADHSFRTNLTPSQQSEMQGLLGELFDTQGHWFYFSLNEQKGPYKFPRFQRPNRSWSKAGSASG